MIRKALESALAERLAAGEADGIAIFTLDEGRVKGALLTATSMVASMRANHGLGIIETLALGQAYIAAALLSTTIKGMDRIGLSLECSGPLRGFRTEALARGDVRGYLYSRDIIVDRPLESFDLDPFIQDGFLSVTRFSEGGGEPYSGQISLGKGGLARNLARYFLESEQTASAVDLGVRFGKAGELIGAGGLFLQALPGADADALDRIERILEAAHPLGDWFGAGSSRRDWILRHFLFLGVDFLEERKARFMCGCDEVRFRAFVLSMPRNELEECLDRTGRDAEGRRYIDVTCHNCGSVYRFAEDGLAAGEKPIAP